MAAVLLAPTETWAAGETITDVRILDNQRTDESTVRSLVGVSIGDTMEQDTLDRVRERLNTAGLFSDVNVWWEQHGAGVRVNVAVKDKFPWAPVPTASWSANNRSLGLVFVHGNLFGRGKQMLFGGRLADVDSGATLAFRDPSLFGTWIYWQLQGFVQKQIIPEYDNSIDYPGRPDRETRFNSYGAELVAGIAWLRRVKTQVAWQLQKVNVTGSDIPEFDDLPQEVYPGPPAARSALVGIGRAGLSFDFRGREFAVMTGMALGASIDLASTSFGSDLEYWRVGTSFERGVRFFRSHNLIYSAYAATGHNLPFWNEYTAGGPNLRGYLYQQFRGDSQLSGKVEYHFPLFSIGSLDFRALAFYDVAAVWFRDLPAADPLAPTERTRPTLDARNYLPNTEQGFSARRDIHNDVGGGLRFFLRSVAIPLVGFDAGYGIESRHWRFVVIVGA
ncbi:MAG TPA: BamA/TamA family outer membrane protein [Polyangia bacterium]|nr:BamA/TamA family outer membrane protein [Polyangia bacterium]